MTKEKNEMEDEQKRTMVKKRKKEKEEVAVEDIAEGRGGVIGGEVIRKF